MGANHRHGGQPRAGGGSIPDLTTSDPFFGFLSAAVKRLDRTQLPPPRCSNLITSVPFFGNAQRGGLGSSEGINLTVKVSSVSSPTIILRRGGSGRI